MRKGRIENISKKWSKNLKFFKIIDLKNGGPPVVSDNT